MSTVLSWLASHWGTIVLCITCALSVLGTVKNALDDGKHEKAETWLGRVMDLLAWVSAHGAQGLPGTRASLPGIPSRPVQK